MYVRKATANFNYMVSFAEAPIKTQESDASAPKDSNKKYLRGATKKVTVKQDTKQGKEMFEPSPLSTIDKQLYGTD